MLTKAYIPYKGYYSSPFSRWQGSMANENAIVLAAETAKRWLEEKTLPAMHAERPAVLSKKSTTLLTFFATECAEMQLRSEER